MSALLRALGAALVPIAVFTAIGMTTAYTDKGRDAAVDWFFLELRDLAFFTFLLTCVLWPVFLLVGVPQKRKQRTK